MNLRTIAAVAALATTALPCAGRLHAQAPPPGMILWLRADSGVVQSGGRVVRWADISGSGRTAVQADTTKRPALTLNAIGGKPALVFDGVGTYLECDPVFPVSSDYTLTVVVRAAAATNNIVGGNNRTLWLGGADVPRILQAGDFNNQVVASAGIGTAPTVITAQYNNTTRQGTLYINGGLSASGFCPANTDSVIFISAYVRSYVFNGQIAEVILYKGLLDKAQRGGLEQYLLDRYGIARAKDPVIDSTFLLIPAARQLYPRDQADSAMVPVKGIARWPGYDSAYVDIRRDGIPWKRSAVPLTYRADTAVFLFLPRIYAGLNEYRFTVGLHSRSGRDTVLTVRDSVVCGDVYLINGQSNSIFGGVAYTDEYCRTFGKNYSSNKADTVWALASGAGYGGGPDVGAWGIGLMKRIRETYKVPVCIINGGVGGTAIEQHQRNDPFPSEPNNIYGSMLYRVQKARLTQAARAMFWYQGESNASTNYYVYFRALYQDWMTDYPNLQHVYVVQTHHGCSSDAQAVREVLRNLGDSLPNIQVMSTMGLPGNDGCHYAAAGYDMLAGWLFRLVARDFYGSEDTQAIDAPNIRRAFYNSATRDQIALVFAPSGNGLTVQPDTVVGGVAASLKDYVYLNDSAGMVSGVTARGDTVWLQLSAPGPANCTVSYLPERTYTNSAVVYQGPYLFNRRGIGALTFHHVPVYQRDAVGVPAGSDYGPTVGITVLPNPATGFTTLRFQAEQAGLVTVVVTDMVGRQVMTAERRVAGGGAASLQLDLRGLSRGRYLCHVRLGRGTHSAGIIVE